MDLARRETDGEKRARPLGGRLFTRYGVFWAAEAASGRLRAGGEREEAFVRFGRCWKGKGADANWASPSIEQNPGVRAAIRPADGRVIIATRIPLRTL